MTSCERYLKPALDIARPNPKLFYHTSVLQNEIDAYRREYFTDPVNMHKVVKYSGEINRDYIKGLGYQIKDYDIGEPR